MPIFLLDHVCGAAGHLLAFSVTNPTLRPGVLFGAVTDVDYLAVTCEGGRLVLARYARVGRTVIAAAPCPALVVGTTYQLRLDVRGRLVRAKLWQRGCRSRPGRSRRGRTRWRRGRPASRSSIRPTSRRRGSPSAPTRSPRPTHLHRRRLWPRPRSPASPGCGPDGRYDVRLRVISAFPAKVTFHTSTSGGATAAAAHAASAPPYTALHILQVQRGERLRWHAELSSPQGGARTSSAAAGAPRAARRRAARPARRELRAVLRRAQEPGVCRARRGGPGASGRTDLPGRPRLRQQHLPLRATCRRPTSSPTASAVSSPAATSPICAPGSPRASRSTTTTTGRATTPTARPPRPGRRRSGTGSTPIRRRETTSTSASATSTASRSTCAATPIRWTRRTRRRRRASAMPSSTGCRRSSRRAMRASSSSSARASSRRAAT